MARTDRDDREATPALADTDATALAGSPVTATASDYRLDLPPLRNPTAAQAILFAGTLAQLGLALLITIYLARVLTPADFGFFSWSPPSSFSPANFWISA